MKNENLLHAVLVLILSLSSCTRLDEPEENVPADARVFYAEVPSNGDDTRTYIDGSWNIYWYSGDKLSVFQSSTNERYRFAGNGGEIRNEFHKDDSSVPDAAYPRNFAVYPYNSGTVCSKEGLIIISLPSSQQYCPDSFGQGANTMVAVTQSGADDIFYFKNVCGYLRLKIYGGDTIRRIVLRGNNGEKIAGESTITASIGAAPSVAMEESATTEITLDCGEDGVQTVDDPDQYTSFWFVVPPIKFSQGFTLDITTTNGITRSRSTDKRITIIQNKVKQMAVFECGTQTSPKMSSFSISDGVNTYKAFDISDGYVNIMVPNQSDLSNMTAKFSYQGLSVKVNGEEQTSGVDAHDFSDFAIPVEYVVTAADGISKTFKIRIFNLPVLSIETPNRKAITSKTIWTENATIKIRNADDTEEDIGLTSIKGRGNFTWNYPKKPYNLKLNSKMSLLGMPEHKRWCLLAEYRGLIGNPMEMEIANRSESIEWNPHGQFVELMLNGEYKGLYFLCEQIRIGQNRIDIQELSSKDISAAAITGGYLLEYDQLYDETYKFRSDFFTEVNGVTPLPIMLKSPNENVPDVQFNYIKNFIHDFEAALSDDERVTKGDYLQYVDIDSFIDYWFVLESVGTYEALKPRSVYMYKGRDGVDSPFGTICKMKAGPAWDQELFNVNHSFGLKNAHYYKQLFKDPRFVSRVKEKWPEFRDRIEGRSVYGNSVLDYLALFYGQIRNSAYRDIKLWSNTYFDPDSDVNLVLNGFTSKLNWMQRQIEAMHVESDDRQGNNSDYDNQDDETGDFNFGF